VHIALEGITPTPYLPITLGHEVAGTVEQAGAGVEGGASGARVAVCGLVVDGTCAACFDGRSELCASRTLVGIHRE
jgi:D-arabinose 1-dehydrogenase-like Zn-dependent alcohol dehydrogenase